MVLLVDAIQNSATTTCRYGISFPEWDTNDSRKIHLNPVVAEEEM